MRLRYALSGIVVFQSKTTLTLLSFYVIAYLTFAFLFNDKSLFGTPPFSGWFSDVQKMSLSVIESDILHKLIVLTNITVFVTSNCNFNIMCVCCDKKNLFLIGCCTTSNIV